MLALAILLASTEEGWVREEDKSAEKPIPVRPAPRETLQDFVYAQVKDMILNGEIEPGRTITIQALAAAFSVSHMPVREALHRLTAARALAVVGGRSMGVPPLSLKRHDDLRRVRMEIEGLAAAWAASNIDGESLEGLESLYATLEKAVKSEDKKTYLRANRAMHFRVYEAAGSPALLSLIEPLWLQISPYFHHQSSNHSQANDYHRALLDALRTGDAEGARRAIQADISAAGDIIRTALLGTA